jgi:hypothetical protein
VKEKLPKMNRLSKKIAKKVGLNYYDVDSILKVATFELIEILKKEQRFYWEGLGVFFLHISDIGLSVKIRLSEEPYTRLNKNEDPKENKNEIIFE